MTIEARELDREPTRLADQRRHGIHLRARLNECVVTLNLTWESAWVGDEFTFERLYGDSDPFRLQNMTSSLLDLLHPTGRSEQEDALVVLMRPRVELLRLAAIDLSGPVVSSEPLTELADRVDTELVQIIGERPSRSSSFHAACIHARRYVVYSQLDRERDEHDTFQLGLDAQRQAVDELRIAVEGSPAYRDWARKDPAFRHLLGLEDFRRILLDESAQATESLRRR